MSKITEVPRVTGIWRDKSYGDKLPGKKQKEEDKEGLSFKEILERERRRRAS